MTCHNCRADFCRFGRNRNGTQRYRCPDGSRLDTDHVWTLDELIQEAVG